jgi:hypothetical protein
MPLQTHIPVDNKPKATSPGIADESVETIVNSTFQFVIIIKGEAQKRNETNLKIVITFLQGIQVFIGNLCIELAAIHFLPGQ